MSNDLRHYGMYLMPGNPEDDVMIEYLDRFVKSRRVGEVLRRIVLPIAEREVNHTQPTSSPAIVAPTMVQSSETIPEIAALVTANDVVQKARKAFFK